MKKFISIILAVATAIAMSGCSGAETNGSETTSTSAVSETTEESAAETTEPGETAIAYDSSFNDAVDPSTKIGRYYAAEDLHFNELFEEVRYILIPSREIEDGVYYDSADQSTEYYLTNIFYGDYGLSPYFARSPYYSEYFKDTGIASSGYIEKDELNEYDPLNKFGEFGALYFKVDGDTVDWLIEDVLNGKADHNLDGESGDYYYNGYYYVHTGENGGGGWIPSDYTAERLDDGTYDITYHVDDDEIIVHVKAGLIEHDGYYFWSLFSIKVDR